MAINRLILVSFFVIVSFDLIASEFLRAEIMPDILVECDISENPVVSGEFVFEYIKIGILENKKIGVSQVYYSNQSDKIGAFSRYSRSFLNCKNNQCFSKGPSGMVSFLVDFDIFDENKITDNFKAEISIITCDKYGDFSCFEKENKVSRTVSHKFSLNCSFNK